MPRRARTGRAGRLPCSQHAGAPPNKRLCCPTHLRHVGVVADVPDAVGGAHLRAATGCAREYVRAGALAAAGAPQRWHAGRGGTACKQAGRVHRALQASPRPSAHSRRRSSGRCARCARCAREQHTGRTRRAQRGVRSCKGPGRARGRNPPKGREGGRARRAEQERTVKLGARVQRVQAGQEGVHAQVQQSHAQAAPPPPPPPPPPAPPPPAPLPTFLLILWPEKENSKRLSWIMRTCRQGRAGQAWRARERRQGERGCLPG